MFTKKITQKLHLWLGLPTGLLVFIIAVTGALLVFQSEFENITQPYRYVTHQNNGFLPTSEIILKAQKCLTDKQIRSVKYKGKEHAIEVLFYNYNPSYYYSVFVNPYTGKILKIKNNENSFFRWVLRGHMYLWLPPFIGKPIVAGTTLIFILIQITGLILWFPKNRKQLKNNLLLKWEKGTGIKRKIFDIHNIPGFYTLIIALIISFTGLVWGFQWFSDISYKITGGKKPIFTPLPATTRLIEKPYLKTSEAINKVYEIMVSQYPNAKVIGIQIPENDTMTLAADANFSNTTYWKTEYRYFNRYNLKDIPATGLYGKLKDVNKAEMIRRMNYDIHIGAIGGWAGKVIVFLTALVIASLPVTGFLLWWWKRQNHHK